MTPRERSLLESLDLLLRSASIRESIDDVVERTARKLKADDSQAMAWNTVPLSIYGTGLPCEIQSSWVFVLRAGAITGAERHPNSCQRMMSYRGAGDLQTGGDGQWTSHRLVSDEHTKLEGRWIAVPENTWHQAVVLDDDWVVVSFHTVPAEDVIEERLDANNPNHTTQRRYLAAADKHSSQFHQRVDFRHIPWTAPAEGIRVKATRRQGHQLRLLEFSPGFSESEWCRRGHIGYVLAGQLVLQFTRRSETLAEGDAFVIEPEDLHRARTVQGPVRLFVVETAEPYQHRGNCLDVIPELPTINLEAACSWFDDVLGFTTAWVRHKSLAAVAQGEVQLYVRNVDAPVDTVRCYLRVAAVESIHERCTQRGARIIEPLRSTAEGMREFAVEAPDGHVLRIGQGYERVDDVVRCNNEQQPG